MLDMTFPEFEAAVSKTDVVLLPLGSIEEHGAHVPLQSDAITSLGQFNEVQRYLRARRIETIVGPPLNIGLTADTGDFTRSGTYMYPGSLTVRVDTFVALYLDVLRSLHDHGLRQAILFSGHSAPSQGVAMARIAREATRTIPGMTAYAMVPSESIERFGLTSEPSLLVLQDFRNFPLLTKLLGSGSEPPRTNHADGAETSLMLFYRPDMVRSGYRNTPIGTSSAFFAAGLSGNRADNPTGTGGFPSDKASAAVGKQLLDYRTALLGDVIARTLAIKPSK
jgi:creatinine amidohydrolase